ncbi:MAG: hypothetical protein ACP5HG_16880 [Anaerolineae bacterium]
MKRLENCTWEPAWVSHLGCLKGCLEYLGVDVSMDWLYGGTGHAFVINMHEEVCPSGPTAWDTRMLFELGANLGYRETCVFGGKQDGGLGEAQERAWEMVRGAIDQGLPCYGWELEIPEFYVICGYEDGPDGGYYYAGPGCEDGKGPKPWRELGDTGIGIVEVYAVRPGEAADDVTAVGKALSAALNHASNPKEWIFEGYRAGLEGYDNWIRALEEGKASDMGMRFNAGVWLECRQHAVGFLREAESRLAGLADAPLDAALLHYTAVAEGLGEVAEIYPWSWGASDEEVLPIDDRSRAAVEALRMARDAEAAGLAALDEIVRVL